MSQFSYNVPIVSDPKIKTFFITLAICSGFYTYRGFVMALAAGAADWMDHFSAVVFAIASSVAIYLLWTASLPVIARLETPRERILGMCLTAVSCIMIASLSSWLNVAGIAGASALTTHMHAQVSVFEKATTIRYESAVAIQQFKPDLKQASVVYLDRRESEIKFGAYTGVPGAPGTIEQVLGDLADRFNELDKSAETNLEDLRQNAAIAHEKLERMRAFANAAGDPVQRLQALSAEAGILRAILGEMSPQGDIDALRRALNAMPRELDTVRISGKSAKSRKAQEDALVRIKAELKESIRVLDEALTQIDTVALTSLPLVERINPIEAVWRYASDHIPYWAGGFAVDFTPTMILLFAMVLMEARGRRGNFTDTVLNKTVGDLIASKHGESILREGRLDRLSMDRTFDDAIGSTEDQQPDNDGEDGNDESV